MTTVRASVVALVLLLATTLGGGVADAHPLGNFTVNHLDVVRVSHDRVDVRWILDQAEIPTFQERGRRPGDVLAAKRAEALRGLHLTVDGRPARLSALGPGRISFPPGQGGLPLTRVELLLSSRATGARAVGLRDATFANRLGWHGMLVAPGRDTAVRSDQPASEPTQRLRRYPVQLLKSPADQRAIALRVSPGDGTVIAPRQDGGELQTTRNRSGDGLTSVFDRAAAGKGTLLLLLFAAFGWGALHALSPGHGKAMVAAYLVGAKGTARHAVILGITVTITHTIGVFALGFVTLALSQYVLPEQLYPWLNLVSGVLVLTVGAAVLRARLRGVPEGHHHAGDHDHEHDHDHAHTHAAAEHAHAHSHEHAAAEHTHTHAPAHSHAHGGHSHSHAPDSLSPRALFAAGATAGLIPCPSALVVLLGALSQHQIVLGLVLILVFSFGLAATLTGLGLAVVSARRVTRHWAPGGRVARGLAVAPALSAVVIIVVGCVLTARAVPGVV